MHNHEKCNEYTWNHWNEIIKSLGWLQRQEAQLSHQETARRAIAVLILSTAAQLYTKNDDPIWKPCNKWMTVKVTQGRRNCRYSMVHISLPISGL